MTGRTGKPKSSSAARRLIRAALRRHKTQRAAARALGLPNQAQLRKMLAGEMQVTIQLRKVVCGTELQVVQEGLPSAIPVEPCYLGWQESLAQLAYLVEPEIPDGA